MRKLIYHVATSLDNYIAKEDGSAADFLPEGEHIAEYIASLQDYDTVVMGRRTYEFGYECGLKPGEAPYKHMRNYVFSRKLRFSSQDENLFIVKDDPLKMVNQLKQEQGTPIYLCGGGAFAGVLLDHHLIDQLIIKHNPVVFGSGIRLFGNSRAKVNLELIHHKAYTNGVLLLTYDLHYDGFSNAR